MVFFTDKSGTSFSLNNPTQFLSARAIQRRQKQQIAVLENDLPVNRHYVDEVAATGAETFYTTRWMNGVLVQATASQISDIEALPFVNHTEYVAPDDPLTSDGSNADGFASAAGNEGAEARPSDFQNDMLGIDRMHQSGFQGEGILIGVFDEGFDNLSSIPAFAHLFEDNRILYTRDFTRNQTNVENNITHGRRVLSVLAADAEELTGTAPEASYILSITEASGEYRIEEYNWLFAAEMADSAGVDIITTSLGYNLFNEPMMDYSLEQMDGQSTVITRSANLAASKGIALVTSAGNTGQSQEWPIITAPADSPDILAVGAVNSALSRARISSLGPSADNRIKPDVAALGVSTAVLDANGGVTFSDGTSFAAPLVAGLMAGVWQAHPELTAAELLDLIRLSGSQYDSPDNEIGYGIPNFVTVERIIDEIDKPVAQDFTVYPNPSSQTFVYLAFDTSFFDQEIGVSLTNMQGQRINRYSFTPTKRDNRIQIETGGSPPGIYLIEVTGAGQTFTRKLIKY
jgi:hypothetical protein